MRRKVQCSARQSPLGRLIFLASTVMTTGKVGPFVRVSDSKIARSSFASSSNTRAKTAERTTTPDWYTLKVPVPVQLAFIVTLAEIVSCADAPPLLLVCVPERFPSASKVNRPTAATGTAPVGRGRMIFPVYVYPHFPATPANEHCWAWTDGAALRATAAKRIPANRFKAFLYFINCPPDGYRCMREGFCSTCAPIN